MVQRTSWQERDQSLGANFQFHDFSQAFAFMTEVALVCEKVNHHPNWSNVWNRVTIQLSTHDAGNQVTTKDRMLAEGIDQIYLRYQQSDSNNSNASRVRT